MLHRSELISIDDLRTIIQPLAGLPVAQAAAIV